MAVRIIDGFDRYGPVNSNTNGSDTYQTAIAQAWGGSNPSVVAGLSATGYALSVSGTLFDLSRALGATATTVIFGFRFQWTSNSGSVGIRLLSGGTVGWAVWLDTTGHLNVGSAFGTSLASSTQSVTTGTTHYLEGKLVFSTGASAEWHIYLDGVLTSLDATGKTSATASADTFSFHCGNPGGGMSVDDLYIFDTTGSYCNALLLTNPRVETQFPSSDSSVQFTASAGVLGDAFQGNGTSTSAPGANELVLRPYTPQVNCTINSIGLLPGASSATAKFKGVIYGNSSGAPHTLLSSGTEVVGCTNGTTLTLVLTTSQSLTAGTQYWIGYITDTSVAMLETDSGTSGYKASNTYTSGAPATAPTMTSGQASWVIYGNCTAMAHNWAQVDQLPPVGLASYNSDSTVGHEDLFGFPTLSTTPNNIYAVAVSASVQNSDAGARTISLRCKSSSTDSGGSQTGQAPGTSFSILWSEFDTDPSSGAAWTVAGLNAATSGYKIDS